MRHELTADRFLKAFTHAYRESRKQFTQEQWVEVWTKNWNDFMLWKNGRPPQPLERSILHQISGSLGLDYWEGEPLKLDSVFFSSDGNRVGNFPFPILVAIEHENDHRGFGQEIAKLLSVRSPLKVGITYLLLWGSSNTIENRQRLLKSLREQVVASFERISAVVGEDSTTEYLYLVGAEEVQYCLTWYAIGFSSGQTPSTSDWRVLEIV